MPGGSPVTDAPAGQPAPGPVVAGCHGLFEAMWADQAARLLYRADQSPDDACLRQPAADLAAGVLVKPWRLERAVGPHARTAAAQAAGEYEARRSAAVGGSMRALPLHRRIATSRADVQADYNAQHLMICVDCAVPRHDDVEQRRYGGPGRCPLCDSALASASELVKLPPELGNSLEVVAERLARMQGGRL